MFKFVLLKVISMFYSEFSFIRLSIITFHIFNDSENDSTSSIQTLNYASNFFDRNLKFCLQQGVCGRHSPYLLYLARLRTTFIASTFIRIEFLTSTISSLRKVIYWANNKRYNVNNCTYLKFVQTTIEIDLLLKISQLTTYKCTIFCTIFMIKLYMYLRDEYC